MIAAPLTGPAYLRARLPFAPSNHANGSHGRWYARAATTKRDRGGAYAACLEQSLTRPRLPVVVTLTRVSTGRMDAHDGLPNALKHVVDGVADYLGVRDHDPRVAWRYAQRGEGRGVQATEIEIASTEAT